MTIFILKNMSMMTFLFLISKVRNKDIHDQDDIDPLPKNQQPKWWRDTLDDHLIVSRLHLD